MNGEESESNQVKYRREGKCRRCGKCCNLRILAGLLSETDVNPATLAKIKEAGEKRPRCPYLKFMKVGHGKMKYKKAYCIQYEKRPPFCKQYPATPADTPPKSCGFKFSPVVDHSENK